MFPFISVQPIALQVTAFPFSTVEFKIEVFFPIRVPCHNRQAFELLIDAVICNKENKHNNTHTRQSSVV